MAQPTEGKSLTDPLVGCLEQFTVSDTRHSFEQQNSAYLSDCAEVSRQVSIAVVDNNTANNTIFIGFSPLD